MNRYLAAALVVIGVIVVIWLLRTAAWLAVILGVIALAAGVWLAARSED